MVTQVIVVELGLLEQAVHQDKPALLVQPAKKEHKVLLEALEKQDLPVQLALQEIQAQLDHPVIEAITEILVKQGFKVLLDQPDALVQRVQLVIQI